MTTSEIPIDPKAVPPPDAVDEHLRELDFDPEAIPDPEGPAPRTIVFDIGEVLVDETRVWSIWADLLGVSPLTFGAVLGAAIAQGEDHHVVFPHLAPNIQWEEFLDEHERRFGGLQEQDLYPDVRPCLEELRALGFAVALAGNQPAMRTEQLRRLALPTELLATSEELGAEKPDPAFFAAVLRALDTDDAGDVLYVGDRVDNDIAPATEFGMRTCWLRRGPWGHLQEPDDDLEIDLVLEGLGELPLLLNDWRG
ncbi:HAD family hydrolase [Egicoccus sp. AB-alg6-2]|uniref:HAD family hydrolase n=1 Tax=Egicoccus sp. AB-alg6-2 TaxID=3242692 RepID=UPI00359DD0BF